MEKHWDISSRVVRPPILPALVPAPETTRPPCAKMTVWPRPRGVLNYTLPCKLHVCRVLKQYAGKDHNTWDQRRALMAQIHSHVRERPGSFFFPLLSSLSLGQDAQSQNRRPGFLKQSEKNMRSGHNFIYLFFLPLFPHINHTDDSETCSKCMAVGHGVCKHRQGSGRLKNSLTSHAKHTDTHREVQVFIFSFWLLSFHAIISLPCPMDLSLHFASDAIRQAPGVWEKNSLMLSAACQQAEGLTDNSAESPRASLDPDSWAFVCVCVCVFR